jgi:hypothetical protein
LPDPNDRRYVDRFPVTADTECQFAAPLVTDLGAVRVINISMAGIGLRVAEPVEAGAVLAVGLRNPARGFDRVHLVHVVHVTPLAGGVFLVGGTLDPPLTYQELTALVV